MFDGRLERLGACFIRILCTTRPSIFMFTYHYTISIRKFELHLVFGSAVNVISSGQYLWYWHYAFVQMKVSTLFISTRYLHTTMLSTACCWTWRDPLPVCILRIPALSLTDCGAPQNMTFTIQRQQTTDRHTFCNTWL